MICITKIILGKEALQEIHIILTNRNYIKFICAPLFMLSMNGCANNQVNSDREAFVNTGRLQLV